MLKRQDEANLWPSIALYGLWLRHPRELSSHFPRVSPGLSAALDEFLRYGFELEILEHDLTECVNEFATTCERLYAEPEHVELKKFSSVYHVDNFHVRLHKLVENVRALLGLAAGLDPEKRLSGGRPFRAIVHEALARHGLADVVELLRAFERDPLVAAAVDARHRFVHRYREEPAWPMLHPKRRYRTSDDPIADAVRTLEGANLDRYVAKKIEEFTKILKRLRSFRDRLFPILGRHLIRRAGRGVPADRLAELQAMVSLYE